MINEIYDQLKTPKTLKELYQRLSDIGLKWNKAQVELFVHMDKNIIKNGITYFVNTGNSKDVILDIIDKTIGIKPMVPIRKIIECIPKEMVISAQEILKVALESGKYQKLSDTVLKKVN